MELTRKNSSRVALFRAHYKIARLYTNLLRSAYIAWAFARI